MRFTSAGAAPEVKRRRGGADGAAACLVLAALTWLAAGAAYAGGLEFQTADFNILSANSLKLIGTLHFEVTAPGPGRTVVSGTARYRDGQYDLERDEFDTAPPGELPRMMAYRHSFFDAAGRLMLETTLDFASGAARCGDYRKAAPVVLSKTFNLPPNAYAGAAMMLPLQESLRAGSRGAIVMENFACAPGPQLVKVEARAQAPAPWIHYPGELVRTTIEPDFGWFGYLIAPFLPELHAWFNPTDGYDFVGAEFTRFYKGPHIILARATSPPPASAAR